MRALCCMRVRMRVRDCVFVCVSSMYVCCVCLFVCPCVVLMYVCTFGLLYVGKYVCVMCMYVRGHACKRE